MANRKRLIAGNWKMNNTISEAVVLTQEISNRFEKDWHEIVDVAICPPYVDLKPSKTVLDFDHVKVAVGAQNVYYEPDGPYTGEISVKMLSEIGCEYCIIGHSERRILLGETNEDVNLKAKALFEGKITPIMCVGEPLEVRDDGDYIEYVSRQIRAGLAGVDGVDVMHMVIAYEPIWAIGTGRNATPEQAQEVCSAIRAEITELYDEKVASEIRILYGGSMNEGNAPALLQMPDIDGGLIGGASLHATSFIAIVEEALK